MFERKKMEIVGIIFAIIISILASRLIFSIPTIVDELKAQTQLLIKIAEQQGVDKETITKLVKPVKAKK